MATKQHNQQISHPAQDIFGVALNSHKVDSHPSLRIWPHYSSLAETYDVSVCIALFLSSHSVQEILFPLFSFKSNYLPPFTHHQLNSSHDTRPSNRQAARRNHGHAISPARQSSPLLSLQSKPIAQVPLLCSPLHPNTCTISCTAHQCNISFSCHSILKLSFLPPLLPHPTNQPRIHPKPSALSQGASRTRPPPCHRGAVASRHRGPRRRHRTVAGGLVHSCCAALADVCVSADGFTRFCTHAGLRCCDGGIRGGER